MSTTRKPKGSTRTASLTKSTVNTPASSTRAKASAPAAEKPEMDAVAESAAQKTSPKENLLRKRDLIDAVVRSSGIKKKDAKPVVEAMLSELGKALADGRELALPPLGRVKVNREKSLEDGRVLIVKVRQKDVPKAPKLSVAAAE